MTALPHVVSAAGVGVPAWLPWAGFALLVLPLLLLDLGVFAKAPREPTFREAAVRSLGWCALALLFALGVTVMRGPKDGLAFVTGYAVEQALSVDNLFVILLVFTAFGIPKPEQRRVLVWGVLGAVVLRGALIFAGTALVARFHFLTYVLGALLLLAAAKIVREVSHPATAPPETPTVSTPSWLERLVARFVPVTRTNHGSRFFAVEDGVRKATPLFLALVTIEVADAIFALDSVPAVLAVTTDPFIVFTSNLFAVLGLRSLFFALAGLIDRLVYLKHGLAGVLAFVGLKMLVGHWVSPPEWLTLAAVAAILGVATIASLRRATTTDLTLALPAASPQVNDGERSPR